jgi:uncharacterized protein
MILLLEEITGKPHLYTIRDTSWFPPENEDFLLTATASISVSRHDSETVLLKGTLEGQRLVACDRCRELVKEALYCEFEYLVTIRKEQVLELRDIECNDDDVITLYLKGQEIDVDEILREQAYLAFPLKTLCSEDCKGICAGCGVVLNSEACKCPSNGVSSTFAILKKLTNN